MDMPEIIILFVLMIIFNIIGYRIGKKINMGPPIFIGTALSTIVGVIYGIILILMKS